MMSDADDDENLICPITQEYFRDPVLAEDGRLYERAAITRWINERGTSPFTRQVLNVNHLQPDDEVRRRVDQRRRLSVSYNRESERIQLPPIRTARHIGFNNRVNDIGRSPQPIHQNTGRACFNLRNSRGRCSPWCDRNGSKIIMCTCVTIYCIVPMLVVIILVSLSITSSSRPGTLSYTGQFRACNAFNPTFNTSSCLSSFTNVTILYSVKCKAFAYDSFGFGFNVSSSNATIIFAFQQASGYWDIDSIGLWDYNFTRSRFSNGDFESGSLSPNYNQCQSTGNISRNTNRFNGRYSYSDGTQGHFGYLMQQVPVIGGAWYYVHFILQNRNGSNSSFAVLLAS